MAFDFDTLERLAKLNKKISECKKKKRECQKKIDDYEAAIKKVRQAEDDNDDAITKERAIDDYKSELMRQVKQAAQGSPEYRAGVLPPISRIFSVYPANTINQKCESAVTYWSTKIVQQNNKISSYNMQIRNYEYEKSLL